MQYDLHLNGAEGILSLEAVSKFACDQVILNGAFEVIPSKKLRTFVKNLILIDLHGARVIHGEL